MLVGAFLCCVLQEGTRGALTGVSPVPPPIMDSKLKIMPVEGVLIGIPAISKGFWCLEEDVVTVLFDVTFRELGLGGLEMGRAELSITFLAGEGETKMSSIGSMTSVLTLSLLLS